MITSGLVEDGEDMKKSKQFMIVKSSTKKKFSQYVLSPPHHYNAVIWIVFGQLETYTPDTLLL